MSYTSILKTFNLKPPENNGDSINDETDRARVKKSDDIIDRNKGQKREKSDEDREKELDSRINKSTPKKKKTTKKLKPSESNNDSSGSSDDETCRPTLKVPSPANKVKVKKTTSKQKETPKKLKPSESNNDSSGSSDDEACRPTLKVPYPANKVKVKKTTSKQKETPKKLKPSESNNDSSGSSDDETCRPTLEYPSPADLVEVVMADTEIQQIASEQKGTPKELLQKLEKEVIGNKDGIFEFLRTKGNGKVNASRNIPSRPAWYDDDDDLEEMERLKKQLHDAFGGCDTSWANTYEDDSSSDDEDSIFDSQARRGNLKRLEPLEKDKLDFSRTRNLNWCVQSADVWTVCEFNPICAVALLAGTSGVVNIVQVDGKKNKLLHSIKYDNFPIHGGGFSPDGNEFFVSSPGKPYIYVFNLNDGTNSKIPLQANNFKLNMSKIYYSPDGKTMAAAGTDGYIHLFTARTKEWIRTMKVNSDLSDLTFNNNGSRMYTHGDTGEMYEFDINSRKCLNHIYDHCRNGTAIRVSPKNNILVTGCDSGSLNIYRLPLTENCTAKKIVQPVYTPVNEIKFNCSGEILAIASKGSSNAIKLIHIESMTKFYNFPMSGQIIQSPRLINFSPSSGFFSVCSGQFIELYRLDHYPNY